MRLVTIFIILAYNIPITSELTGSVILFTFGFPCM